MQRASVRPGQSPSTAPTPRRPRAKVGGRNQHLDLDLDFGKFVRTAHSPVAYADRVSRERSIRAAVARSFRHRVHASGDGAKNRVSASMPETKRLPGGVHFFTSTWAPAKPLPILLDSHDKPAVPERIVSSEVVHCLYSSAVHSTGGAAISGRRSVGIGSHPSCSSALFIACNRPGAAATWPGRSQSCAGDPNLSPLASALR